MYIDNIIHNWSYPELFLVTVAYFLFLYFVLGPLFLFVCRVLERRKLLTTIAGGEVTSQQTKFEKRHSIVSIVIFGFSSWPLIYLIRTGVITLLPDSVLNTVIGLVVLTLWNEVHFFIVHRFMHLPFFMKHVHFIHHRSAVPTVWSVYSFHWFEALLLSTVPLALAPFVPLSAMGIALYPLASVLLNFAGHCNYRFGNGHGPSWQLLGTRHAEHHSKRRQNYGFASSFLDWLYSNLNTKKK